MDDVIIIEGDSAGVSGEPVGGDTGNGIVISNDSQGETVGTEIFQSDKEVIVDISPEPETSPVVTSESQTIVEISPEPETSPVVVQEPQTIDDIILEPETSGVVDSESDIDLSSYLQTIIDNYNKANEQESEIYETLMSEIDTFTEKQDIYNNNIQLLLIGILLTAGLLLGVVAVKTLGGYLK